MNPSRLWAELAAENKLGVELCTRIVDILVSHCFHDNIPIQELRQAMPSIYAKLTHSNPDARSTAMALEAAASVGLYDIGKSKKDAEDRLVFEAAIIMLLYLRSDLTNYNYPYRNLEEFLNEYPDFRSEAEEELVKLFNFANCMKVAIQLIKPKLHKSQLLILCTRLTEGKGVKYVTGSGQRVETKRRVAIYEHEGGVKAESRPWRLSWNLITDLLKDDNEKIEEVDISQRLISTLQEQPDFRDSDMNTESIRFRHPTIPNVHVEATEMKTPAGQTLIRAMSLSRVQEDSDGNVIEAKELHREFSVTGEVWDADDLAWLNEFDQALRDVENYGEEDISVSRQSYRQDGQLVKGISISKQFPDALDADGMNGDSSEYLLGNAMSLQFAGSSGLMRSLSAGSVGGVSPRPQGWSPRAELGAMSPAAAAALGRTNSLPLSGPTRTVSDSRPAGLQRMNSSNSSLPSVGRPGSFAGLMRSLSGGSYYAPPPEETMTLQDPQSTFSNNMYTAQPITLTMETLGLPEAKRQRTGSSEGIIQTVDMWSAICKAQPDGPTPIQK